MNINDVIIRPIITEKSSSFLEHNVYTFEVDIRATKAEVKRAVEVIFTKSNAKVNRINMIKIKRKPKKLGKYQGYKKQYKKAMVYLASGTIPIYGSEGIQGVKKKSKIIPKIIDTEKIMEQAEKEGK